MLPETSQFGLLVNYSNFNPKEQKVGHHVILRSQCQQLTGESVTGQQLQVTDSSVIPVLWDKM